MSARISFRRGVWFENPPPLALYIHFPWCVAKCPYCDFNSHQQKDPANSEKQYLEAFERDLEAALPSVWGRRIETIFLGGGTPSLLSPEALDRILRQVRTYLPLAPDLEITLEANPGTVDVESFVGFREAGVNRVSLGIQSFSEASLKTLGRIHSVAEAERAIKLATELFPRVNLDLMVALPNQSIEAALHEVDRAIDTGVTHLSCYQLTLEPNTPFYQSPPPMLSDDDAARVSDAVTDRLVSRGFHHYETSAYARERAVCRHNMNYWTFGDYLGLGPGAHSKLSYQTEVIREVRQRSPQRWIEALAHGESACQSREAVKLRDLPFEFAMNAFRLLDGFDLGLFETRAGRPMTDLFERLERLVEKGLVIREFNRVAPTELGQRFLNDLIAEFLPDD
jgi:oxygen-independent coproporphyrinogen-3 oxidase